MDTLNFWKNTDGTKHITAGKTEFPEGWDPKKILSKCFAGHLAELGCGYGRLSKAFKKEFYTGLDINENAIKLAIERNPGFKFQTISGVEDLIKTDSYLCYTVLLHISDDHIKEWVRGMCLKANRVLVCEILGRHWRPPTMGKVPVFNRNKEEYEDIFSLFEFKLKSFENLPYKHYSNTNISFMEFCK